jgi:hypothetical protein
MKALNFYCIVILFFSFSACKKESSKAVNEPAWLKQDLVAFYPLNGNIKDSSGNNLNGIPNGILQPTVDRKGKQNSALYFNNAEFDVNINNTIFNQDFTISIWVLPEELTAQYSAVIWGHSTFILELVKDLSPKQLNFYLHNPSVGDFANVNAAMDFTSWNHIIITNTAGVNSLYLNGTFLNKSQTSRPQIGTGASNFFKVGRVLANPRNFKGKIDDLRIYKRALTSEEVKYLYQN